VFLFLADANHLECGKENFLLPPSPPIILFSGVGRLGGKDKIVFPVLELTDWTFDLEKILESEFEWDGIYHIKERDIERQYQRVLVDYKGNILKVTLNSVLKKKGAFIFYYPTNTYCKVRFRIDRQNPIAS
jgi:hypothetical protein